MKRQHRHEGEKLKASRSRASSSSWQISLSARSAPRLDKGQRNNQNLTKKKTSVFCFLAKKNPNVFVFICAVVCFLQHFKLLLWLLLLLMLSVTLFTVYCPNYVSVLLNRRRISVLILFYVPLRKLLAFFFPFSQLPHKRSFQLLPGCHNKDKSALNWLNLLKKGGVGVLFFFSLCFPGVSTCVTTANSLRI